MRVITFGTYDASLHPRAAVLIEGLSQHGWNVQELNARLGLGTAARVSILQQPYRLPVLLGRLVRCWAALLRTSFGVGRVDVVLVPYLGHFDVVLARLRWPRTTIALDHLVSAEATARDRGERGRLKLRAMRILDQLATRSADIIVVDTVESAERLPAAARPRSVVVPVGATDEWFEARRIDQPPAMTEPLKVVFFGSFTPLQGTTTIARALARIREGVLDVTLIGEGQDHAEVRRILMGRGDVRWHDWVPIEDLPKLVAEHDVCLGIFGATEKALTVVPTKIYQGAAAACALVTSDTLPHRRMLDGAAVLVAPSDDCALADALLDLAADRDKVARLREAALARAAAFTPLLSVAPLAAVLDRCSKERGEMS